MVRRHVARGRQTLKKQRRIVDGLRARSADPETAETVLDTFEVVQCQHFAHQADVEDKDS